jgi:hypothetical protein
LTNFEDLVRESRGFYIPESSYRPLIGQGTRHFETHICVVLLAFNNEKRANNLHASGLDGFEWSRIPLSYLMLDFPFAFNRGREQKNFVPPSPRAFNAPGFLSVPSYHISPLGFNSEERAQKLHPVGFTVLMPSNHLSLPSCLISACIFMCSCLLVVAIFSGEKGVESSTSKRKV